MKVLLVRPQTPKASINLQSFMICEPLELEYVAASLKERGHEVDLVDMLIDEYLLNTSYDSTGYPIYGHTYRK